MKNVFHVRWLKGRKVWRLSIPGGGMEYFETQKPAKKRATRLAKQICDKKLERTRVIVHKKNGQGKNGKTYVPGRKQKKNNKSSGKNIMSGFRGVF